MNSYNIGVNRKKEYFWKIKKCKLQKKLKENYDAFKFVSMD